MWSVAMAQLRTDVRRSLATFVAVLLSVTAFCVLFSSATTQRLQTTQTVADNFRGSYDIVVRPSGARTSLEADKGLLRPNYLAGAGGGISLQAWRDVQALPGTEVAAPVAMVGIITPEEARQTVDISDAVADSDRVLLRYRIEVTTRQGTFAHPGQSGYAYVGRDVQGSQAAPRYTPGAESPCPPRVMPNTPSQKALVTAPFSFCVPRAGDGKPQTAEFGVAPWPYLVAAIDPAAEAALLNLDGAVTEGRYLTAEDDLVPEQREGNVITAPRTIPALISREQPPLDFQGTVHLERLPPEALPLYREAVGRPDAGALDRALGHIPGTALPDRVVSAADVWASTAAQRPTAQSYHHSAAVSAARRVLPGDVRGVVEADGSLRVEGVEPGRMPYVAPATSMDDALRPLRIREFSAALLPVGAFDPSHLTEAGPGASVLPLETYRMQEVLPADDATRAVIGPRLGWDLNIRGYLQQPPTLLIPLAALADITDMGSAPISAIRVRAKGVTGMDPVSRERIRALAEDIQRTTGLDVDITAGTSLARQTVHLPATSHGTPALNLTELWSKKGVAVEIVDAIDVKSAVLLGLIIVSGIFAVAISATASVAARRRELAILAAVGWRRRRLLGMILLQFAVLAVTAGLMGAVAGWPIARASSVGYDWRSALLAIPTALAITMLSGLVSALGGAKTRPMVALRPIEVGRRRLTPLGHHGPLAVGLGLLLGRPSRLILASMAVALGAAAFTILEAIVRAFDGRIIGTLLGEVVSVQARTPDRIAAVCLVGLGVISVVLVLFLGALESARTYATLQALGWRAPRLVVTVAVQGLLIGLLGSCLGAALGLVGIRILGGSWTRAALMTSAGVAAVALMATVFVALVPALAVLRHDPARSLVRD